MSRILRSFRHRGSVLDYRIRLCLFVSLFALSLISACLQISYGVSFVRNLFTEGGEYSDIDIFQLDLGHTGYEGAKFKTRGIIYYSQEGYVYLQSYLVSNIQVRFPQRLNPTSLPNGSFIEVKGEVRRQNDLPYQFYIVITSWEYSSISYEVLIDFLTASVIVWTSILLVLSTRVIGASIALRAYTRRELARETL